MLFLAEFGSGIGVMILDITAGSINAALVPGRLRARVQGAYTIVNYGVRPLGALAAGLAADVVGIHTTLWIATDRGRTQRALARALTAAPSEGAPAPRGRVNR